MIVGAERGIVNRKNDGLWLMVVCSPPFWKLSCTTTLLRYRAAEHGPMHLHLVSAANPRGLAFPSSSDAHLGLFSSFARGDGT